MKKIALLNPPFREAKHRIKDAYPLGLGYIKAFCKSKGIRCELYDFSCSPLSDPALVEKYRLSDYDVIGVSSYSLFFNDTVRLINLLKNNQNIIIVGGHHATLCGTKILQDFPAIDFCLKGFGEKSFYELVSSLDTENVYSVPGLCYRKDGKFIDNPVNYNEIDIDEFPSPDRNDIIVDAANYEFDVTKKVFHISTSRGCPYHCTYCVNCKNNYWFARSEASVLEELNQEFRGKEYKYINFVDCNFYVNPSRAESLIARIRDEYPGVKFSFQTRSDQVAHNKGRLEKLLSAGDCSITLGIESNSAQVLKRYRKETTPEINQDAISFLRQTQSQTLVYMIMFEALESLDDIRASFDFLKNNDLLDYATVGNIYQTLVPFYGSHYYDDFHDYYIGSIHERTKPIFVDNKVQKLYDAVCEFRNLYEDKISEAVYILSSTKRTKDENEKLLFLVKIQYIIFEYLLVLCENFGICDLYLIEETGFKKRLDEILEQVGGKTSS
ncbi:MAG: radical SAM protein [bacterium]|nr:radical SAM protein [bacterium]